MEYNTLIKSPMNYTGGKYKLLPQILPLFPSKIDTFVDLFTGGGNVRANRIISNDFDAHVIGIYNAFKNMTLDEIIGTIEKTISKYELSLENADGFNALRMAYNKGLNEDIPPYALDMLLYVLICYSFNHQLRFNSRGEFNMPFGKNRSQWNDTMKKNLVNFHKAIIEKDIIFTNKDFGELKVDKLTPNDFVYCDPPYLITCATYNEKDGWNINSEKKLLNLLDELNKHDIKFGLSNVLFSKGKANDMLIEWSKKYNVNHLDYTYQNCNYHTKDKDSKPDEVLITNF